MTIEDKRAAIEKHCQNYKGGCNTCVLADKPRCYTEISDADLEKNYDLLFGDTEAADERGDKVMETQTVTISLERYEELILKEALCDKLTVDKDVTVFLIERLEEKANV